MTLAYFLGDSLTSSVMAATLCDRMGWTFVDRAPQNEPAGGTIDGAGGTGYLNAADYETFGGETRFAYVVAAAPSVVFVIGGGNDNGLDTAAVIAAAEAFWTALRAALPGASLYVSALHRPCAEPKHAGIVAAAESAGAWYIDASTWAPELADEVHPTAAGNVYLGQRLAYVLGANRVPGINVGTGPLMIEVPTQ